VSTVLRHYEIMVILDPSLEERTVAPSLDTYLNVIRTAGGSVEKTDVWGRRRLAYEINKTPEAVAELDRQLRLNESVLRTKVIRPEMR
jgi:small subunit ribosomal protein S6